MVLDDAVIGRGSFSNKKTSKQLAALESLEALCPGQYPRDLLLKNVNLEVALKDDLNEVGRLIRVKQRHVADRWHDSRRVTWRLMTRRS